MSNDIGALLRRVPEPDMDDIARRRREIEQRMAVNAEREAAPPVSAQAESAPKPVSRDDRSRNPLRPRDLDGIIGQERAKAMMRRVIDGAKKTGHMDHTLLVGAAGTGKTTFANVIAEERGVDCYQMSAPVSLDTLLSLREVMKRGDILFIDEIHMQAIGERRGKESITQPEVFLQLLEDFVIATGDSMLPFPEITVIGATTDPGRLPDPFLDRFPLQPRLAPYSEVDLAQMAIWNAEALDMQITVEAAVVFAQASRGTPRVLNNYVKNAKSIAGDTPIDQGVAAEVLIDLNNVTLDGLTLDQREMLVFLYTRGRRESAKGDVVYQASVSSIATGIGLSRDQKAVQLRVEPYLIQRGFVQVAHGGRVLTDAGVARAAELATEVQI